MTLRSSGYSFRPRLGVSRGFYAEKPLVERGKADVLLSAWSHRLRGAMGRSIGQKIGSQVALELEGFSSRDDDWMSSYCETLRGLLARDSFLGPELIARAIAFSSLAMSRATGKMPSPLEMEVASGLLSGQIVVHGPDCDRGACLALASSVAALSGVRVHVLCPREQRAKELGERFREMFDRMGLTSGSLAQRGSSQERKSTWNCDVAFVGVAAMMDDFLKDRRSGHREGGRVGRLVTRLTAGKGAVSDMRLRGLQLALLDDASGLLCDFSTKPYVVKDKELSEEDHRAKGLATRLAEELVEGVDFRLNAKEGKAELTPAGEERLDSIQGIVSGPLARPLSRRLLVEGAIVAHHLYALDRHYEVAEGRLSFKVEGGCISGTSIQPSNALKSMLEVKEGIAPSQGATSGLHSTLGRALKRYLAIGGAANSCDGLSLEICRGFEIPVVKMSRRASGVAEHRLLHESLADRDEWFRLKLESMKQAGEGVWVLCLTPDSVGEVQEIGQKVGVEFREWEESGSDPRDSHVLCVQLGSELPFGPEGFVVGPPTVIIYTCLDALHVERQLVDRLQPAQIYRCVSFEDPLAVRLLPAWYLKALRWLAGLTPRVHSIIAMRLTRVLFLRAEKVRRSMRESYAKAEEDEHKQLSFTGPPSA